MANQIENLPAVDKASTQMNLDCVIKALDELKRYPQLLARLGHIMNHTESSEDGETAFVSVADAGEVYTILLQAWVGDPEYLDSLTLNVREDGDRAINGAHLVRDIPDAEGETAPVNLEGDILIAIDWT